MAGADNLKGHGFDELTADKQREIARKGAQKSVQVRRHKRELKQTIETMLSLPPDKVNRLALKEMGLKDSEMNMQAVMAASMLQEAIGGNVRAAEWISGLIVDKVQATSATITIVNDIPKQTGAANE